VTAGFHIGRGWEGHEIEDACPCPQEPCGLVDLGRAADDCDQHHPLKARSTRQGHSLANCPGPPDPAPDLTEETPNG
jgi:hypothetical protein